MPGKPQRCGNRLATLKRACTFRLALAHQISWTHAAAPSALERLV
jgi:hypothetical protein